MVYLDPAIRVEIEDDYDLVAAFMKWQLETKNFPFRGGSSGLGNLIEWFPVKYETELKEFFHGK